MFCNSQLFAFEKENDSLRRHASIADSTINENPVYDEIPVFVTVPGLGSFEVPAIVFEEMVYLSISSIFDQLHIRNEISFTHDSISGFFLNQRDAYLIDRKNNQVTYGGKVHQLNKYSLIYSDPYMYLHARYFGMIFGLECTFNFRSLSVLLNTRLELPVIRDMRQQAMRNNINQLKGETKADTIIPVAANLFSFGTADWSVVASQNLSDVNKERQLNNNNIRANLSLGGILAGGEATLSLNYDNQLPFAEREQFYQWRLVNNERKYLRQAIAGKIFTQSSSSIYSPVVGVQFSNTPTTYRRSFGTYVLSDKTEPNWMVELYVNNVLVDYVKADASGFYKFEVPLVYGNSVVKLRFYGPWGEDRTTEQNLNIPFNFLPQNQLEYTISAGMVEDSLHSSFSRINVNYGLGKRLTVGGGFEHLSSVGSGANMPFMNASLRIASNLLFSTDYLHGVRLRNVLSYRLPSNFQVELSHIRYKEGQKAINNTFLEERRAVISYPFRSQRFSLFSRFTFYQVVLPHSKYTNLEGLMSGVFKGVNMNLTTYALMRSGEEAYVYSNFSSTFRLPSKIIFTPQFQFEYNNSKLISYKGEIGKHLKSNGYLNAFYEKNLKSNFESAGIGFRYDINFAQMSMSARRGNQETNMVQAARGSVILSRPAGYIGVNNRANVGKGGIMIIPFLDLNNNGKRDKGEPRAAGLQVQTSAGRARLLSKDTSFLISDLEAYTSYVVKLNTNGFENIAWQIKNKTIKVSATPNHIEVVDVAVSIISEVSGSVYINDAGSRSGIARITVLFFDQNNRQVGKVLSESDGFYSFSGLTPGKYTVRIDSQQLERLGLITETPQVSFTVEQSLEGDVIENISFDLKPQKTLK